MTKDEIILANKEYLFPAVFHYFKEPLVVERGKDQYVWDADGKQYLDFLGGIVSVSVGHCNEEVNAKVHRQMDRLQHVSTVYANEPQAALAKKIASLTPEGKLTKSFFTNSGSEANETAILTARCYTGSTEMVALRHSYHGRSAQTMTLTGQGAWRLGPTNAGVVHAHNAYCYRCPFGLKYPDCEVRCAEDMEDVIRSSTSGRIAGFIGEPIQGVAGFITPPKEYFKIVERIVRNHGGIFISDEVQTAWGRTGNKWFGIEHWGVTPDIMTGAKGLGNGSPIGLTVARPEVADSVTGLTISTFGGNPVTSTAAKAVIDYIEDHRLPANCAETGAYLRGGLEELREKHEIIGDVRGMGLLQAIELVEDRQTKAPATAATAQAMEAARENGLLLGKGGMYGNVLRFSPPMNIGRSDVDQFLGMLDKALAMAGAAMAGGAQMSEAALAAPDNRERFPELHPALDGKAALAEANRCLFCFDAPCTAACPTHIDVPGFIKKISSGNPRGSALTILDANILGLSCSRVCPVAVLCEGACVMHGYNQKPIEIGRLQRHAMDYFYAHGAALPACAPARAKGVACVGGGPASLACAAELRRHGYSVTIFDNRPLPGGLNTYGIAEYKLRPADSLREVELVRGLGVEFRQGEVGATIPLDQLETEFDLIFLGPGLGAMERLGIPGEQLPGVIGALHFIERYKTFPGFKVGRQVVVIGGGNTAIDAANAARRLGAEEVHLFYRRTEKEMPAFPFEYQNSKVEGVRFHWLAQPLEIVARDGRAAAVKFAETRLEESDASGRRRATAVAGSHFEVACDMVIPALGQSRLIAVLRESRGIELEGGSIAVDRPTGRTSNPRYYAGGDCVNGGREVVDAVADGKRAALAMARQLEGAANG